MGTTMYENNRKLQAKNISVFDTLFPVASILATIYCGNKQIKLQRRIQLEPLYEKMLSTIPTENRIVTKSDIFDEGDSLISAGTSSRFIISSLEIRKTQSNIKGRQKIDSQIEAVKQYDLYWKHYSDLMADFEDELKMKTNLVDRKVLGLYMLFIVSFHNEHCYRGPVITTDLLKKIRSRLEQAIIKQIY